MLTLTDVGGDAGTAEGLPERSIGTVSPLSSLTYSGLSFVTVFRLCRIKEGGGVGGGLMGFLRSPFCCVFGAGAQSMPNPLA